MIFRHKPSGWGTGTWTDAIGCRRSRDGLRFRVTDVTHSDLQRMSRIHPLLRMIFAVANHCASHVFYEGFDQHCPIPV